MFYGWRWVRDCSGFPPRRERLHIALKRFAISHSAWVSLLSVCGFSCREGLHARRGCHSDVAARSRCLLPWSESPGLLRVEHRINPGLLHPVLNFAMPGTARWGHSAPQKAVAAPGCLTTARLSPSSPIATMMRSHVSAPSWSPLRRISSTISRALAVARLPQSWMTR